MPLFFFSFFTETDNGIQWYACFRSCSVVGGRHAGRKSCRDLGKRNYLRPDWSGGRHLLASTDRFFEDGVLQEFLSCISLMLIEGYCGVLRILTGCTPYDLHENGYCSPQWTR